jgi:hypothetical protein
MEFRYDTFCGLYCGACDVSQANRSGTVAALARDWGMEPDQLRCQGCKSAVNAVYCIDCDIKACASSRTVEYCFQCADYPCVRLLTFRDDDSAHHSVVSNNLDRLREQGLDRWLAEQRLRWTCPSCGAETTWYETACRACGGQLYNCQDEERRIW